MSAPGAEPDPTRTVEEQTRTALHNILEIVRAAGGRREDIARVMIQVTDMDAWGRVNDVYADVMGDHKPARAIVPVKKFAEPYVVEVVATAALGG